jgi:hypothetical protein
LQSFVETRASVEFHDGGIPRINTSSSSSSLVLGKIDANSETQPLKLPMVQNLSFQVGFQLKDENSNET